MIMSSNYNKTGDKLNKEPWEVMYKIAPGAKKEVFLNQGI